MKNSLKKLIFLILIFSSGLLIGHVSGKAMMNHYILSPDRTLFLLYKSGFNYFSIIKMLNSENEMFRLSGYYLLLQYNLLEDDFVLHRINEESSIEMKYAIIDLFYFHENYKDVEVILTNIYKDNGIRVKKRVLSVIKKRYPYNYRKFKENIENPPQP